MAQARELGDKAMRNLARLREEASAGKTTPPVAHLAGELGWLFVPTLLIEKLFLIVPAKREIKASIHQHLQVGLGRHLTFRYRLNERRRYERQFRQARDVTFGQTFAARDLNERTDAA